MVVVKVRLQVVDILSAHGVSQRDELDVQTKKATK
jgi:hypothetical protein